MRSFTLILPYYRNPTQLARQFKRLARLPDDVRRHLHLIVCDDGSPKEQAFTPKQRDAGLASFKLFRVEVDIPWNWLTCRNIGAYHAETGWILMTDMDHELPEVTARRIIFGDLLPENVYRFSRVDADKPDKRAPFGFQEYKPHPNTWLMTKAMYQKIGGYNERLSGNYGTDGEFRDRVRDEANDVIMLEVPMIRVPGELVPDARTRHYARKEGRDPEGVRALREKIEAEGLPRLNRSFPYHQVYPPVAVSQVA